MVKQFKNLDEVWSYIEKNIVINLEQIGKEVRDLLYKNVDTLWYGRGYTPTHYTRTRQLIDSITVSKARKTTDGYEVLIYFDSDKIEPLSPGNPGEWTRHKSIVTDTPSAVYLPLWIEKGQNSPLFSYEGVHAVEKTKQEIISDDLIKKRIMSLLGMKGFKVM